MATITVVCRGRSVDGRHFRARRLVPKIDRESDVVAHDRIDVGLGCRRDGYHVEDAGDFFPIGAQERSSRIERNDVELTALGDVAPFEVVRTDPVADDVIRALLVEGRGDVGADEPGAAGDHVHAAPPFLRCTDAAMIGANKPFGGPRRLIGLDRRLSA